MARRPRPSAARRKLDRLIDMFVPDIRRAFRTSIQGVVDNVVLKDMIKAIELGDPVRAFQVLGYSPAAMRPLTAMLERAFEQGGVVAGEQFPGRINTPVGRAVFRFDVRNSRSEAWLRDQSSRLVTKIGEDTRTVVRNVLTEGMQAGRNPRNVALDLIGRVDVSTGNRHGGVVGLTPQQQSWVNNTRRDLENLDMHYFTRELRDKRHDRTVLKAINDGKPLPTETVDLLVGRYNSNALRYRGETIARTEAIQSLNQSEYEAVKQAVDMGSVTQPAVQRVWDSAGDSRVRWSHKKLDGQTVGLDEAFVSPSGARMMFPGDTSLGASGDETIMCRCRVRLKVDWLADID